MRRIRGHLTFANVISLVALFVALGGGAYAAFHLPKNSVRSRNIVNEQVKKPDLKPAEPFHKVGAPGEPPFGNGGEGDCKWGPPTPADINPNPFDPPAFYKDPYGVVHLTGVAVAHDGPGGDAKCDEQRDHVVFRLPPPDRPAGIVDFPSVGGAVIIQGRKNPPLFGGAGSVFWNPNPGQPLEALLNTVSFRAAGVGVGLPTKPAGGPPRETPGRSLLPGLIK